MTERRTGAEGEVLRQKTKVEVMVDHTWHGGSVDVEDANPLHFYGTDDLEHVTSVSSYRQLEEEMDRALTTLDRDKIVKAIDLHRRRRQGNVVGFRRTIEGGAVPAAGEQQVPSPSVIENIWVGVDVRFLNPQEAANIKSEPFNVLDYVGRKAEMVVSVNHRYYPATRNDRAVSLPSIEEKFGEFNSKVL